MNLSQLLQFEKIFSGNLIHWAVDSRFVYWKVLILDLCYCLFIYFIFFISQYKLMYCFYIQVFEGTSGIDNKYTTVQFTGEVMFI